MTDPFPASTDLEALRDCLREADYTPSGVATRLGEQASGALYRGDLLAVRHELATDTDPLATLIRLFPAGATVPGKAADAAFGGFGLAGALAAGIVEPVDDGTVRAAVDVRPYGDDDGDWWVVSDLGSDVRPGPLRRDHVLGIGGASVTLAGATVRTPVEGALDLGTGCGVQALHLSRHVTTVTGTDVSARALRFAATTAALNGLRWDLLQGDLVAPVAGQRFDLVVSNPPFIVGPGFRTHEYRDSGRAGDGVCAELIAAAPRLLNPGGHCQLLANWLHVAGEPWEERVAGWLSPTGCDAYAVQREILDPAGYVALWLRDAGQLGASVPDDAERRTADWLDWFAANRVEAVGFGLVSLRASGASSPTVRVEEAVQELGSPLGPEVAGWFDRVAWLRGADLLTSRLTTAPGLRLRQTASHSDGWEVDQQVLALESGWRWAQEVDPVTVALVGGCDGSARLGDQLALLAAAYEAEPVALAAVAVPLVARLVERGMLLPAGDA